VNVFVSASYVFLGDGDELMIHRQAQLSAVMLG
jgi:hypothetical protein